MDSPCIPVSSSYTLYMYNFGLRFIITLVENMMVNKDPNSFTFTYVVK